MRNKVTLIGNLGANPVVREMTGGRKIARFSLATTDGYRNKEGEYVKETQWHNLVMWGKTAELAEKYLEKGKMIAAEGKLMTRLYEDKSGEKRWITEILVSDMTFLTKQQAA